MDEGEFYIAKWLIEHSKLTAKNYHRCSKIFEIRKAGQRIRKGRHMDDDIKKLDKLIAAVLDDFKMPRVVTDPGEATPCVDPSEFIVVVEFAQGGAVVHHPIMKTATTLQTLEALAKNILDATDGAIKSSVCHIVREQYLEEE